MKGRRGKKNKKIEGEKVANSQSIEYTFCGDIDVIREDGTIIGEE